jgi:hypothetical protein
VLHAPPVSSSAIWSPEYSVRIAVHEAPLVSSHTCLPRHLTFNTPASVRTIT